MVRFTSLLMLAALLAGGSPACGWRVRERRARRPGAGGFRPHRRVRAPVHVPGPRADATHGRHRGFRGVERQPGAAPRRARPRFRWRRLAPAHGRGLGHGADARAVASGAPRPLRSSWATRASSRPWSSARTWRSGSSRGRRWPATARTRAPSSCCARPASLSGRTWSMGVLLDAQLGRGVDPATSRSARSQPGAGAPREATPIGQPGAEGFSPTTRASTWCSRPPGGARGWIHFQGPRRCTPWRPPHRGGWEETADGLRVPNAWQVTGPGRPDGGAGGREPSMASRWPTSRTSRPRLRHRQWLGRGPGCATRPLRPDPPRPLTSPPTLTSPCSKPR
jgi:hypothetical protein